MKLATGLRRKRPIGDASGGSLGGKVSTSGDGAPPSSASSSHLVDERLRLKPKESLHVLIQLRAMLSAGVPLLASLRTLGEHANSPQAAKVMGRLASVVESGHDLSFAMDCLPRCFEKYVVHLLAAGEKAGALDQCLERSAELLDKQIKLNGKIKGALAYPGFLLFMTFIMTSGILIFLVPKFEKLLLGKPELLPWTTKLVLATSTFLRQSPVVGFGLSIGFIAFAILTARSKRIRQASFQALSRTPVVGALIHKAFIARSVSTLALTMESGVPILTGLEHAAQVSELPKLQALWRGTADVVRDGRPMHTALQGGGLPPALVQMMVAGEASGQLDQSLKTASEFLDRETDAALQVFTGLLGPACVVIAGGIVGFIVVALMTPILQLAKFVG